MQQLTYRLPPWPGVDGALMVLCSVTRRASSTPSIFALSPVRAAMAVCTDAWYLRFAKTIAVGGATIATVPAADAAASDASVTEVRSAPSRMKRPVSIACVAGPSGCETSCLKA